MVNNPPANAGDIRDLILDSGRSAGGGHGNLLQYSYPKNPIDRRAWWATVHASTDATSHTCTRIVYKQKADNKIAFPS